jgi:hypothetical protein
LRAILKNCGPCLDWALFDNLLFLTMLAALALPNAPRQSVAIVKAILWNLIHFRDTFQRRLKIQESRREGDERILAAMYPSYSRVNEKSLSFLYRVEHAIQRSRMTIAT